MLSSIGPLSAVNISHPPSPSVALPAREVWAKSPSPIAGHSPGPVSPPLSVPRRRNKQWEGAARCRGAHRPSVKASRASRSLGLCFTPSPSVWPPGSLPSRSRSRVRFRQRLLRCGASIVLKFNWPSCQVSCQLPVTFRPMSRRVDALMRNDNGQAD